MTAGNPFLPPAGDRQPARRFRGRLAAPVTLVTAGSGSKNAGLTISSLLVNEGEPAEIHMVVSPVTDLWEALAATRRCVVHIADAEHAARADVFAGLRPSPGGIFSAVATLESEWGPVITDLQNRAFCRVVDMQERGWSGVVILTVDRIEVTDLDDPLVHFRGAYRRLR